MKKNDGGSAYPVIIYDSAQEVECGLSIRDHFAGLAMQGVMTMHIEAAMQSGDVQSNASEIMARQCYEMADAMIAEREKP